MLAAVFPLQQENLSAIATKALHRLGNVFPEGRKPPVPVLVCLVHPSNSFDLCPRPGCEMVASNHVCATRPVPPTEPGGRYGPAQEQARARRWWSLVVVSCGSQV